MNAVKPEMFKKSYGEVFDGDERWRGLDVPEGETYRLGPGDRPTSRTRRTSRG